jgi:hypothetical protein
VVDAIVAAAVVEGGGMRPRPSPQAWHSKLKRMRPSHVDSSILDQRSTGVGRRFAPHLAGGPGSRRGIRVVVCECASPPAVGSAAVDESN